MKIRSYSPIDRSFVSQRRDKNIQFYNRFHYTDKSRNRTRGMQFAAVLYLTSVLLVQLNRTTAADQAPIVQFFYWNVDPFFSIRRLNVKGTIADSFKLAALHCRRPSYNTANNCTSGGNQTFNQHQNNSVNSEGLTTRKFVEYIKVGIGHQKFHDVIFSPDRLSKLQQPIPQYRADCDQPLLQIWGVLFMDKRRTSWFIRPRTYRLVRIRSRKRERG